MKEKIIHAAVELFMKYGLKSVSMDDIAKSVGISKKTLYLNISDKQTLVEETLKEFLAKDQCYMLEITNRKDYNALEKMVDLTKKGIEIFRKIRPTLMYDLKKYYRDCWDMLQNHHVGFMHNIIRENIEQGQKEQVYRSDIDADIISKLFIGKIIILAEEDQFPIAQYSKPYLYLQQLLYHLYGIVNYDNYPKLEILSEQFKQTNQ